MHQLNYLANITKIGRNDYRVLAVDIGIRVCNIIHAEWESTSCIISTRLTYSVRKISSSISSRLMHGSFRSIFFTRTQSVKRRMLLGCHKHANLCRSYPSPGSIAMIQIAFLNSSIFCASFASTWCSFRSLYNLSMYLGLGLRGFFLPTFIVATSLATFILIIA